MIVRPSVPDELPEILAIVRGAFAFAEFSDGTEHLLVDTLHCAETFVPELSLTAELHSQLVGYVLLTPISIKNQHTSAQSLALAPIAVLPPFQGKGIGKALIAGAHRSAVAQGYSSVVVLGNPSYYTRFGYVSTMEHNISLPFDAPASHCMIVELVKGALVDVHGEVVYPIAFAGR